MATSPWQKEWNRMQRQEYDFLRKGRFQKKSRLNDLLERRIPENLQGKLDAAFSKAFELIFNKGTGIIEKTYNRDNSEENFLKQVESTDRYSDREALKSFRRRAQGKKNQNLLFSSGAGIGMGIVGVGLPDIPVFTATMLRGIYQVALDFGYDYDSEDEKYFILRIIEVALCSGSKLDEENDALNDFIERPALPKEYDQHAQIACSSAALSKELLYMKFLQGIPVVGAVGGAYDAIYMQKILKYAELKYHRRFLIDQSHRYDEGPSLA